MNENNVLGYYFYFSKLYPFKTKNFTSYMISDDLNNNEENQKIVKYKTIIKPIQKIAISNEKKGNYGSDIDNNKNIYNNNIQNNEDCKGQLSK